MAIQITATRLSPGGTRHEHITDCRWRDRTNGNVDDSTKATLVRWIDNESGVAYVGSGADQAQVGTVHPCGGTPYLRTYADGEWNNNLLALPRF